MKIFYILLILSMSFPAAAFAKDTCTLQLDALKPVLAAGRDNAVAYSVNLDKKVRRITENLAFHNGMTVTYTAGGCEHYGFTYTFKKIPLGMFLAKDDLRELAPYLLIHLPGFEHGEQAFFAEAFKKARTDGTELDDAGGFICGDAYCTVERVADTVTLSYDFAL